MTKIRSLKSQATEKRRILLEPIIGGPRFSFRDARAELSATNAHRAALLAITDEFDVELRNQVLQDRLHEICNSYWYSALLDEAARLGMMKAQIKATHKNLAKAADNLHDISRPLAFLARKSPFDQISPLLAEIDFDLLLYQLGTILVFFEDFSRIPFTKSGTGAQRVFRCCWSLWLLREDLTGRPFAKSFDAAPGRTKNSFGEAEKEFTVSDARFVQMVLTAIDPKVAFKTIRTSLLQVAKRPPSTASKNL